MAQRTASLFSTGNTPGNAKLTTQACVFGSAPNAVDAPEKILVLVCSWVCVSSPMTTSHSMLIFLLAYAYANLSLVDTRGRHSACALRRNSYRSPGCRPATIYRPFLQSQPVCSCR